MMPVLVKVIVLGVPINAAFKEVFLTERANSDTLLESVVTTGGSTVNDNEEEEVFVP